MELTNTRAYGNATRALWPALLTGLALLLLSCTLRAETPDDFKLGWNAYEAGQYQLAMDYWLPLAKHGDANAQLNLGLMYDAGYGMQADPQRAVHWYRQSAENGLAAAQFNLGLMYRDGQGVDRDMQRANSWIERAAQQGLQIASALLEAGLHPAAVETQVEQSEDFLGGLAGSSTGTAWSVTGGYVVTSEHVVADVTAVELYDVAGQRYNASVVLRDEINDIALLRIHETAVLPPALPLAQVNARTGTSVFTLGFPRVDVLGRTPKLSTGIISASNGYRDDPTSYQTSVQIQPGNSGGPLINMKGEVVGVMAAMLGDHAGAGGTEPGLSYAVKAEKIHAALRSLPNSGQSTQALSVSTAELADLAERVQEAVLLVVAAR